MSQVSEDSPHGAPGRLGERTSQVRVAHVITDLQVGGEATVLSWLLPALREHGIASRVFALAPNVHDPEERETLVMAQLRRSGIDVVDLGVRSVASPGWAARLVKQLHVYGPAVVHTYLYHAGLVCRPLARLVTRSPVVSSVVGVDSFRGAVAAALERVSLRSADRILVNTRAVEKQLRGYAALAPRLVLQYQGVDVGRVSAVPAAKASIPEGSPVVAVVGRLHPEKGPDVAVDVLAALRQHFSRARLLFVGGGPMKGELHERAAAAGLEEATTFLGPVTQNEVFGLLKAVDLLLVPSRTEGLPAVVLEAFAARTPVVATAVGGTPEVVEPEVTGLLADTPDAVELARLCGRVLEDDVLRRRIVDGAFERALAFPASALVLERAGLYRQLASS